MLTVGDRFPDFRLKAVVPDGPGGDAFAELSNESYPGKWLVVFFWPKDFTFVCPTEIASFGMMAEDFAERDAQVFGASVDSEFVHRAWRRDHEDLRDLPIPMVSDLKRELCEELGILDRNEGVPLRASYIVDPTGVIRFVSVNDLDIGRNPKEILRILDALRTGGLCPCGWEKGQETLVAA
jgi:alkyl hydroperoxide reductase subunit AhpC